MDLQYVINVEPPRCGNGLLIEYLSLYFNEDWHYCEFYHCCQSVPCVNRETIFQRNHDFELDLDNDHTKRYLIQLRHPVHSIVSHFEVQVSLEQLEHTRENWVSFSIEWIRFYQAFVAKWVLKNTNKNILIVTHEDIRDTPVLTVAEVVKLIAPNHQPDMERLKNVATEVHANKVRDPCKFEYFDPLHFALLELEVAEFLPQLGLSLQFIPTVEIGFKGKTKNLYELQSALDFYLQRVELLDTTIRRRTLWTTQNNFKTIIEEKDITIERLQGTVTRLMRENMGLSNDN